MIGDPFELGTLHEMITLDPEIEIVGGLGYEGFKAVMTVISLLKGPNPKVFTAATLNR